MIMKMTMMTLAAATALAASGEILFQEDFSHYRDSAPGTAQGEGVSIGNDPIYSRQSEISLDVAEDTDVFLDAKPLPAGNAFDVLFRFNLANTNCAFAVNFAGADGKAVSVPVSGFAGGWRDAVLKADGRRLTLYVAATNCFGAVSSTELAGELKNVNFRVNAGGRVSLTRVVVRTPEPLSESPALAQFPAGSVLNRTLDDVPGDGGVRVSDGTPLDLAKFGCSFVPGTTGVVGSLDVTWDSGAVVRYPIAVDAERFRSAVPRIGLKQLGLKPGEDWIGPDAVIDFGAKGRIARQTVDGSPIDFAYTKYGQLAGKYLDGQLARANYGKGWTRSVASEDFLWDGLALIKRGDERFVNEPHIGGGNPVASSKGTTYFNDALGTTVGVWEGRASSRPKFGCKYTAAALTAFGEDVSASGTKHQAPSTFFYTGKPEVAGLGHAFLFRNYRAGLAKWQTSDPDGVS